MCNCVSSALMSLRFLNGTHGLSTPPSSNLDTQNPKKIEFQLLIQNKKSNPKSSIVAATSKPEGYQFYDELGLNLQEEEEEDIQIPSQDNTTISSEGFDFLEFEKKEIHTFEDQDELVQLETFTPNSNASGLGERKKLRKGRQVMRRSSILAKQVISVQSALALGFVSQLWVDTCSWVVLVVEVRPSMLSGEMERFLLEDVCQVGDVVLVEDESVFEEDIKMFGLDTLVGYNVVTPNRRSIGKVRGFTFNIESGAVELLELDSFGISVIPSSLVSTYGLFLEDVVDVESDTVVVHEAAASRIQRLTKGFWDTNMETFNEQLKEYPDYERRPVKSTSRRNRKKSTPTMKESEDDLQLPMDYL